MNSSTEQIISNSLSLRLKQETAAEHGTYASINVRGKGVFK